MSDYRKELIEALDGVEESREKVERERVAIERMNGAGINPDQASEAEWLASQADKPNESVNGNVIGLNQKKKPLTESQEKFARGIIEGKTKKQAYREAYPNQTGTDATINAAAYKLLRDQRVQKYISDSWEEQTENIAEDLIATKRYVMRSLLALSKTGQQESSRLKALELLGRHAGMWEKQIQTEQRLTAEDLRRELSAHLKLVGS